jgi:transcriptional regulator with XRE-family HTH domain
MTDRELKKEDRLDVESFDDDSGYASSVFAEAQKTLRNNLTRLIAVADETDDGTAKNISKRALVQQSGIGRSTLYNMTNGSANPDLQTLSRIAAAFNVPLSFLLMSPKEWLHLTHALADLGSAFSDEDATKIMAQAMQEQKPRERSQYSLALARRQGVYTPPRHNASLPKVKTATHWKAKQTDMDLQRRRAIRATASLPDYNELDINAAKTAFTLCILMGAVTRTSGLEP